MLLLSSLDYLKKKNTLVICPSFGLNHNLIKAKDERGAKRVEPQHGRKGSDSHGSVAGAGGKRGLEGHDVELC